MQHGFGAMISFDVGESEEDAKTFVEALNKIYHAVSLGATETMVCLPYLTTMLYLPPERRLIFGVKQNSVRLSAGIEEEAVLIEDIETALGTIDD